ncbi:MAG: hypothetical protein EXS63_03665 [Candidatus Omnitrophica bacterium]|nr:hypothetical protein [Candidatus Omnitrophota bacterium]
MDIHSAWSKALKQTEIVRFRLQPLHAFETTKLPYIFLAESSVNLGDTVVRKGAVAVDKPSIHLPSDLPQLEGFDFERESKLNQDLLTTFLLVRGVRFPSFKYQNKTESLDLFEGRLKGAIDRYSRELHQEENISTGLIVGPEDCWQFSVLIFICMQVQRSADSDIRKLMDDYRRKNME